MPQRRGSEALFLFAIGLLAAGAQNGLMTENGAILFGLALLVTTLWLLRHDIARLNVRRSGPDPLHGYLHAGRATPGWAWPGSC